ncbi:glycosyltransferase family 2 protein [Cyanobacterium sp. IPPAS B-1200]|uniref:glycosyltransferase family 2 protein n=1 Tax=Cyanobacterium sp. IPPAS B-1200 TaxID=1562720 RepID=UPI0008525032|nr:glycosyltransferase family 2 protein [Cyanobacterium sp. IPPAS B-1200]OEJ79427.1 glycosyl transferase family 2 [Cyanobacterium sp. IPPAS B-1200]
MPKVSVCIPTYNRANYLQYSVNSVLNQTYSDFELIICDDGSTDNTAEIVNNFKDNRIKYIRHKQNIGRSKNMRSGFENATGEYFIKFDDDDALTPEFLKKTVTILEQNKNIDFVCTNHWVIDANNNRDEVATQKNSDKWGKSKLKEGVINDLIYQTFVLQSLQVGSSLFRYEPLKELDYMNPLADGCEDFDLLVRMAIAGKNGYFLPEFLMEYRFHGQQNSLKQNLHFLKAKKYCLETYNFTQEAIEKIRYKKLADINLCLGLRMIENNQNKEGRTLIQEAEKVLGLSSRSLMGKTLSYLPYQINQFIFQTNKKIKPKDYADQVRSNS